MTKASHPLPPSLTPLLSVLGDNIRLARLRRRLSTIVVAERAGIARNTLRAIEQGEPSVALGAYARVLLCLQLEKDVTLLAKDDELGRQIQDAGLTIKKRAPKSTPPATTVTAEKKAKDVLPSTTNVIATLGAELGARFKQSDAFMNKPNTA